MATKRKTATTAPESKPKKKRNALGIDEDVLERARSAAFFTGMTMGRLMTMGLEAAIEKLQRDHNGGKPFPARKGPLPAGRKAS